MTTMSWFPYAASALALLTTGCSVLPEYSYPTTEEQELVVRYELRDHPTSVIVPTSDEQLTVLWLRTDPGELRETFSGGVRRLHIDDDHLVIRCRVRAYEKDGSLPTPLELFPEASSIRTLWRRRYAADSQ